MLVLWLGLACNGLIHEAKAQALMKQQNEPILGVIVPGGVVCPMFLTDNGSRFPLQGLDRERYPVGTRLSLVGQFVRVSKCMQGPKTLQVEQVLNVELPQ